MTSSASRAVLPVPDPHQPYPGLVTYDAKDPATSFPPIRQVRPPDGAPNVLVVLIDDAGFAASSPFGGAIDTPTADRLAADGLRYSRFHTTALCSPTRQALLTGRNHHSVGMGGITEIATSAPGYTGVRPNTAAPLAETLKLNGYSTAQFGKCHEVPVYETSPMGPFDAWPTGGGGFEHFYGFIGGETNQWYPAIYEGTTPVEPWGRPEDGYHFTEDLTDHAISWVRQQKSLDARQAVLHVLRAGRDTCAASRPEGVDRAVPGPLRRRVGRIAGRDLRAAEDARRDSRRRRADRPAGGDPGVGRHGRRLEAGARSSDGGVRRVHVAHRPPRRSPDRHHRGSRRARRHPRVLHRRRQRRVGRGHGQRHVQRDADLQRRVGVGDRRVHGVEGRPVRRPRGLQPLRRRLGARHGHAVPVDQAGRLALGRHPQRHDRPLAQRVRRSRRDPLPVLPRDRRRPDRPRSCRPAGADVRARRAADAAAGHEHGLLVRRRRTPRNATTSSTSRCSSTAGSTTRAGPRALGTPRRG